MAVRVHGRLTTLRPATETDIELLVAWHADPEVARFWDGKTYTPDQMRERLARPHVDAFIVEGGSVPVGYLQAWRGDGAEGGLDMFLVPAARGRGFGPDAASALARHLVGDRGWTRVTVDPDLANPAAIRAWSRAGFVPVGERDPDDEHSGTWLLMEFGG